MIFINPNSLLLDTPWNSTEYSYYWWSKGKAKTHVSTWISNKIYFNLFLQRVCYFKHKNSFKCRILYLNILNPVTQKIEGLIAVNCSSLHRILFQSHNTGLVQDMHVHKTGKTSKMETNRLYIWVYRKNSSNKHNFEDFCTG